MKPADYKDFLPIYSKNLELVYSCWTSKMQEEISRHCIGWSPESFDFRGYLEASSVRFYKAYLSLAAHEKLKTICDIGGFWGVFPLTLKQFGYDVTMTESMQYYSEAFDGLFNKISKAGVNILEYDPFEPNAPDIGRFDAVTVLAVLEHYPSSVKVFMDNIRKAMKDESYLYIEVPNIAYLPKRLDLLFGKSPLVNIEHIYKSEVPFIGHHHEYTMDELLALAKLAGFEVLDKNFYNYLPAYTNKVKNYVNSPIKMAFYFLFENCRECLSVGLQKVN